MKKMITFFSEINKKGLLTIIPLVVVLFHLAMPAAMSANVALSSSFSLEKWPVASEAWPSEAWPESSSLNAVSAKWPVTEQAWPTSVPQDNNWQYMGKVRGVCDIRIVDNGKDVREESETLFVYSQFDGQRMIYKAVVSGTEEVYEVHKSSSYDGSYVRWRGNRVSSVPYLSQMYTHYAGPYYFNVSNIHK